MCVLKLIYNIGRFEGGLLKVNVIQVFRRGYLYFNILVKEYDIFLIIEIIQKLDFLKYFKNINILG